ncbi:hypothetical protein LEP1GSC202_2262 [Leptospira yanagawae serovar Saopaulo str. Sao Paulo = ATCC 700523]|uniref:Lipoprotein n=2 Tax=Leptospira yanagawae TaxID=293069 RepID=A0ABY2M1V5_9LEPT|nr:hypothetical protein [Leptospira yanagawae]EOQ88433.1 hypothetical protein LEP1GSC202_2262 [Leptospira yanagawae serovar Saopaulo str. Sao Paulo = ATCC 700523]TGL21080.1 hypothetical protein EHQ46_09040 [Leptospira yanagawae]
MRKISFIFLSFILCLQCNQKEEEGLIPGQKITGNALSDAILFLALSNSPCHFITNENASQVISLGDGSFSVCSSQQVNGSLQVKVTGNYEVTANLGRQTLTSSNCSSTRFDVHVALKEDTVERFSTKNGLNETISLSEGKTYSLEPSGMVDPSLYQCQGRAVSSSVSAYRVNFRKL